MLATHGLGVGCPVAVTSSADSVSPSRAVKNEDSLVVLVTMTGTMKLDGGQVGQ